MDLTANSATHGTSSSIADPTDFASTPLAGLAEFDSLLRCQICKDFYTNAVITSCFHSFCSLCMRRSLAADGRCPTCRATEQESRLRRNVALQELTDSFVNVRPTVLNVARQAATLSKPAAATRGPKRKRADTDVEGSQDSSYQTEPRTRSQRKRAALPESSDNQRRRGPAPANSLVIDDSDQDYQPTSSPLDGADDSRDSRTSPNPTAPPPVEPQPSDGLVPCPICTTRMKPEAVFNHLDSCDGQNHADTPPLHGAASTSRPAPQPKAPHQGQSQSLKSTKPPPERLPQINYSILKEGALRKKLSELGIPSWGPKPLLIRRHTEWISLWNANCDSARPRSRRELLSELDGWERSQGGHARNADPNGFAPSYAAGSGSTASTGGSGVMRKDFDGQAWAQKNKSDFDALIASARQGKKKLAVVTDDNPGNSSSTAEPQNSAHKKTPSAHEQPPVTPTSAPAPRRTSLTPLSTQFPSAINHQLQSPKHEFVRRGSSPVPGFNSTLDPNSPRRLTETRRRSSISSIASTISLGRALPAVPTLRKAESSLPERMLASLGEGADVRKRPMFELPGEPVTDSDSGALR